MEKERVLVHFDEEHEITYIFIGASTSATYTEKIDSKISVIRDLRTNEVKSIKITY